MSGFRVYRVVSGMDQSSPNSSSSSSSNSPEMMSVPPHEKSAAIADRSAAGDRGASVRRRSQLPDGIRAFDQELGLDFDRQWLGGRDEVRTAVLVG